MTKINMNEKPNKRKWSWLTDDHYDKLIEYCENAHFQFDSGIIPFCGEIHEALYMAIFRDGRPRKIIANDIGINQSTLVNVIKRNYKPKITVSKKIIDYCARFNCKIIIMKSI